MIRVRPTRNIGWRISAVACSRPADRLDCRAGSLRAHSHRCVLRSLADSQATGHRCRSRSRLWSAPPPGNRPDGRRPKVSSIGEPLRSNPDGTATLVYEIMWHVNESLFTYDKGFNPVPLLAESHAVTDKGLRHTITLRKGVKFHNGKEMTSADVVPSLRRWGRVASIGRSLWKYVESVDAKDPYTVVISLKQPSASLIYGLSEPHAAVYPKESIDAAGEGQLKEFIGTGPYRFVEHKPDRHIKLARFKDYSARAEPPGGFGGKRTAWLDEILFLPCRHAVRLAGVETGEYHHADVRQQDPMIASRDCRRWSCASSSAARMVWSRVLNHKRADDAEEAAPGRPGRSRHGNRSWPAGSARATSIASTPCLSSTEQPCTRGRHHPSSKPARQGQTRAASSRKRATPDSRSGGSPRASTSSCTRTRWWPAAAREVGIVVDLAFRGLGHAQPPHEKPELWRSSPRLRVLRRSRQPRAFRCTSRALVQRGKGAAPRRATGRDGSEEKRKAIVDRLQTVFYEEWASVSRRLLHPRRRPPRPAREFRTAPRFTSGIAGSRSSARRSRDRHVTARSRPAPVASPRNLAACRRPLVILLHGFRRLAIRGGRKSRRWAPPATGPSRPTSEALRPACAPTRPSISRVWHRPLVAECSPCRWAAGRPAPARFHRRRT